MFLACTKSMTNGQKLQENHTNQTKIWWTSGISIISYLRGWGVPVHLETFFLPYYQRLRFMLQLSKDITCQIQLILKLWLLLQVFQVTRRKHFRYLILHTKQDVT